MEGRDIRSWHRRRAEMLAKQLPNSLDDAIVVLSCLTEILERGANSVDLSDLTAISSMLLQ